MKRIYALTKSIKEKLKPALWGNAEKTVFSELQSGVSRLYLSSMGNLLAVIRMENAIMVVVAVVGSGLRQTRQELIDHARANGAVAIRFHTRAPEHLAKGLTGLPINLVDVRKRLFGRDEYIYRLETM